MYGNEVAESIVIIDIIFTLSRVNHFRSKISMNKTSWLLSEGPLPDTSSFELAVSPGDVTFN